MNTTDIRDTKELTRLLKSVWNDIRNNRDHQADSMMIFTYVGHFARNKRQDLFDHIFDNLNDPALRKFAEHRFKKDSELSDFEMPNGEKRTGALLGFQVATDENRCDSREIVTVIKSLARLPLGAEVAVSDRIWGASDMDRLTPCDRVEAIASGLKSLDSRKPSKNDQFGIIPLVISEPIFDEMPDDDFVSFDEMLDHAEARWEASITPILKAKKVGLPKDLWMATDLTFASSAVHSAREIVLKSGAPQKAVFCHLCFADPDRWVFMVTDENGEVLEEAVLYIPEWVEASDRFRKAIDSFVVGTVVHETKEDVESTASRISGIRIIRESGSSAAIVDNGESQAAFVMKSSLHGAEQDVLLSSQPHPIVYSANAPYRNTLHRIARKPEGATELLRKAGMQYDGTLADRSRALMYLMHETYFDGDEATVSAPTEEIGARWMHGEMSMGQVYTQFCACGRMIFEFSEILSEEMLHSDLGEAIVGDIQLPYDTLYVKFNFRSSIRLSTGRPIDGFYVMTGEHAAFYLITFVGRRRNEWPDFNDLPISAHIENSENDILISDALDKGLESNLASLRQARGGAADELGMDPTMIKTPQIDSAINESAEVRSLLSLAANALLYLSIYPEEIGDGWSEGAPEKLVQTATSGKPKKKDEAVRHLWSMGYTRLKLCGLGLQPLYDKTDAPSGRTVRPHWRRGHWRRVWHGVGRTELRRARIRPVIVNYCPGDDMPPLPGRIYQISADSEHDQTAPEEN